MDSEIAFEWALRNTNSLPGCSDEQYRALWRRGCFEVDPRLGMVDTVDRSTCALVASAIRQRKSLFLGLPDVSAHRAPVALAAMVIREAADCHTSGQKPRPILLLGSSINIRDHLASVRVHGIQLDSALSQAHYSRSGSISQPASASHALPPIFTAFSPADPPRLLRRHLPTCIAIDCASASPSPWLEITLSYARTHQIPVIGWGANPFSGCAEVFQQFGIPIWRWPASIVRKTG